MPQRSAFAVLPSSRYFAETSRRDKAGFWFQLKSQKSRSGNQISICG
jgi:hypothetical protein